MKIKHWLIVSYLVVMLLPIAAIYFLYINLSDYSQEEDLKEYLDFQALVNELDRELKVVSLYQIQPEENYQHLLNLVDHNIKIDLYRYDGIRLFSTIVTPGTTSYFRMNQDDLFRELNVNRKNLRTYSVKKLVFNEDNHVVGLYEITMGRKEWVETANERTMLMIILSAVFFIALYAVVIIALNRKLNRPLSQLQKHMMAFAKGEKPNNTLIQSKDEIGVLITHYEQMKAEIEESRAALAREQQEKEYMVASLSHDLKTPLTVIRAYSEALENYQLSEEERKEYQEILNNKLEHMKQMIDDLSVFTALQSSKNLLHPVIVNGFEFFEMVFASYEEPCAQKDIVLTTEFQVRNSYEMDPKQIIRVVDNLMDNSIRFTPNQHRIWLAAIASNSALPEWVFPEFNDELNEWREDGTVILVQNEGKGINESQLEKIFQPFYQDNASRGKGATSGLGLSIAKMIMEKHDGKMTIFSIENKGALIACWLKERGNK